jgi:anion-transporting  ArsA/GET3 family ATPase
VSLADLFRKKLLIFSGKGGVGKSTVTAAVAVAAARAGKRVLVVEIGEHETMSRIFGGPAVGYAGGVVHRPNRSGAPPITAMCITPAEALKEYGMRTVKFKMLYNAVFDNPVIRYFAAAAPAVEELNLLGKIESLERELLVPARNARFDLMLLDAPATGHALALFEAPGLAMRLAQAGPIYSIVERLSRLLSDPQRTAANIVSLPEEMPVNESIELDAGLRALGLPEGLLIVNGMYPKAFTAEDVERGAAGTTPTTLNRAIIAAAESVVKRRAQQEATMARLRSGITLPVITLPLLVAPQIGPAEIAMLADRLSDSQIDG